MGDIRTCFTTFIQTDSIFLIHLQVWVPASASCRGAGVNPLVREESLQLGDATDIHITPHSNSDPNITWWEVQMQLVVYAWQEAQYQEVLVHLSFQPFINSPLQVQPLLLLHLHRLQLLHLPGWHREGLGLAWERVYPAGDPQYKGNLELALGAGVWPE